MRGPPAQHLPAALNELELGTRAGQSIALQLRTCSEGLRDQGSAMPGGVVEHESYARIVGRRIGPSAISHVPRKARFQAALPPPARLGRRRGSDLRDQVGGEPPRHEVECTKDVHQIMAVQVAPDRPMPFEAQGRSSGGNHRDARFIVTAQDQFTRLGFLLRTSRSWRAISCWAGFAFRY
jgi:hypothetical protein